MITKTKKNRIITLAERGLSELEIAEEILVSRAPQMYVRLCTEVTDYITALKGMEKEE